MWWFSSVECPAEFSEGLLDSQLISLLVLILYLDLILLLVLVHPMVPQLVLNSLVFISPNHHISVRAHLIVLLNIEVSAQHASVTKVFEGITDPFADHHVFDRLLKLFFVFLLYDLLIILWDLLVSFLVCLLFLCNLIGRLFLDGLKSSFLSLSHSLRW